MDLADEVRAALAGGEPLGDPQARDLLTRLLDALEDAEERLADADLPARRAEAAEVVDEARRARERILRDLARRRHEARREVAQLQAGRDRLLETFASVRGTVDASTRELNLALAEARLRAGEAGREIDREQLPTPAALDADLELARLAKLPLVAPEPEPAAEPAAPTTPEQAAVFDQDATPKVDHAAEPVAEEPVAEERDEVPAADPGGQPVVRVLEPVQAIVEGAPDGEPPADPEPTAVELVEQRAAQRLKRVLADEQNEVLDRLRQRDRRRTLTVDLLLGGDLDRIARYRDALLVVLLEAGDDEGESRSDEDGEEARQADAVASDAAEAIVRGTRSRVEVLLTEAVDGLRACFREWKTQWLVRLAADSVALASAGRTEPA
jgi:hypothetical protein